MGWWGCKIEAFLAKKGTYERRGREDGVTVEGDEGGGGGWKSQLWLNVLTSGHAAMPFVRIFATVRFLSIHRSLFLLSLAVEEVSHMKVNSRGCGMRKFIPAYFIHFKLFT